MRQKTAWRTGSGRAVELVSLVASRAVSLSSNCTLVVGMYAVVLWGINQFDVSAILNSFLFPYELTLGVLVKNFEADISGERGTIHTETVDNI
jgi:hypothetical protein